MGGGEYECTCVRVIVTYHKWPIIVTFFFFMRETFFKSSQLNDKTISKTTE